jgi:hypothetical protein
MAFHLSKHAIVNANAKLPCGQLDSNYPTTVHAVNGEESCPHCERAPVGHEVVDEVALLPACPRATELKVHLGPRVDFIGLMTNN